MSTIATLTFGESGSSSLTDINTNFGTLNTDKQEKVGGAVTGNLVKFGSSNVLQDSGKVVPTGAIVGDTDAQTLSGKTLSSPILTTPRIGQLNDTNANPVLLVNPIASAVNYIKLTNAITGTAGAIISAEGETNIDLQIAAKGTGKIHRTTGVYGDLTAYSPASAGTATLTLNTSNVHRITMPAGNITIAISNAGVGQAFILDIIQDSTGSRTVTWFTTIKWAGGSAPVLTTTANKIDTFGFIVTSAGNYQGYIVGQNL